MTDADLEVERIAALAWSTFSELAWSWPGDATLPDRWRDVARAVIADRAAQPLVTGGPTLMEVARERDALRHLLDDAKTEAGMQEAWANDLQAALCAAVEWMAEDGCDCGTDEPGSCALCVARAVIADRAAQPPVPVLPVLMDVVRERDAARRREKKAVAENARLRTEIAQSRPHAPCVPVVQYACVVALGDKARAERDALQRRLAELEALRDEVERLRRGITAVSDLIDNSRGVTGLHLNGDEARWDDLRTGGRFEEWLRDFDAAKEQP